MQDLTQGSIPAHIASFAAAGMFQAFGNTLPSLIASPSRVLVYVAAAVWVSHQPWFELKHLWWLSVVTVGLQMLLVLWFVRREMASRLARMD